MPDFLDKLHTAALRAKNLEVGIHDYVSVIKPNDTNRQPSQERLTGDNTRTGDPGQIYAWNGHHINGEYVSVFSPALEHKLNPPAPRQVYGYISVSGNIKWLQPMLKMCSCPSTDTELLQMRSHEKTDCICEGIFTLFTPFANITCSGICYLSQTTLIV